MAEPNDNNWGIHTALLPLINKLQPGALKRAEPRLAKRDDKNTLDNCHPEVTELVRIWAIQERARIKAEQAGCDVEARRWLSRVITTHNDILETARQYGMSGEQLREVVEAFDRTLARQKQTKRQR